MKTKALIIATLTASIPVVAFLVTAQPAAIPAQTRVVDADVSESGAKVSGTVFDPAGRPVVGAQILALADGVSGAVPQGKSNGAGVFQLTITRPGEYRLVASCEKLGYPPTDSTFHYTPGTVDVPTVRIWGNETLTNVVVALGPKAVRLKGFVQEAGTGKRVTDAEFTFRREDNPDMRYVTNLNAGYEEGKFDFLVPPSVPFLVEIAAPGYEEWRLGGGTGRKAAGAMRVTADKDDFSIELRSSSVNRH